jgi:hypothetical protein
MPVFDAVWLFCGSAETRLSVRFIFEVVAVEPDYLTDRNLLFKHESRMPREKEIINTKAPTLRLKLDSEGVPLTLALDSFISDFVSLPLIIASILTKKAQKSPLTPEA